MTTPHRNILRYWRGDQHLSTLFQDLESLPVPELYRTQRNSPRGSPKGMFRRRKHKSIKMSDESLMDQLDKHMLTLAEAKAERSWPHVLRKRAFTLNLDSQERAKPLTRDQMFHFRDLLRAYIGIRGEQSDLGQDQLVLVALARNFLAYLDIHELDPENALIGHKVSESTLQALLRVETPIGQGGSRPGSANRSGYRSLPVAPKNRPMSPPAASLTRTPQGQMTRHDHWRALYTRNQQRREEFLVDVLGTAMATDSLQEARLTLSDPSALLQAILRWAKLPGKDALKEIHRFAEQARDLRILLVGDLVVVQHDGSYIFGRVAQTTSETTGEALVFLDVDESIAHPIDLQCVYPISADIRNDIKSPERFRGLICDTLDDLGICIREAIQEFLWHHIRVPPPPDPPSLSHWDQCQLAIQNFRRLSPNLPSDVKRRIVQTGTAKTKAGIDDLDPRSVFPFGATEIIRGFDEHWFIDHAHQFIQSTISTLQAHTDAMNHIYRELMSTPAGDLLKTQLHKVSQNNVQNLEQALDASIKQYELNVLGAIRRSFGIHDPVPKRQLATMLNQQRRGKKVDQDAILHCSSLLHSLEDTDRLKQQYLRPSSQGHKLRVKSPLQWAPVKRASGPRSSTPMTTRDMDQSIKRFQQFLNDKSPGGLQEEQQRFNLLCGLAKLGIPDDPARAPRLRITCWHILLRTIPAVGDVDAELRKSRGRFVAGHTQWTRQHWPLRDESLKVRIDEAVEVMQIAHEHFKDHKQALSLRRVTARAVLSLNLSEDLAAALLAPLLYVASMYDPRSGEADAFELLSVWLQEMGQENHVEQFDHLLRQHDPEVHRHLSKVNLAAVLYATRWTNLYLSRDVPFTLLLPLWDSLFADSRRFSLLPYICLAMVRRIRTKLLQQNFVQALGTLCGYPWDGLRASDLIGQAIDLRDKIN